MENGIIIYRSKYGAAQKYAEWLKEMTGFECDEVSNVSSSRVLRYETVIFCGSIYASGISGISFLKKNMIKLHGKKLAIFCVGASPYDETAFNEIKEHNLKGDLGQIPVFYGRGAWDESKMTFADRILCKMLQKAIAGKNPDTYEPWMKALMSAQGQVCDWTDKKYLIPLIEYLV